MSTEPRVALDRLLGAFQSHFEAVVSRRGDDDPAVEQAYARLAEAFETYDEALFETFDEATPLVLFLDDESDDDESDDDEDDEDDDLEDDFDDESGEDDEGDDFDEQE